MGEQPASGTRVLKEVGGFEILSKVGQGGMGAVFKARQKSLDRIVALKVLPPNIARDKNFIERFVREARASARLTHPNVVTGIDVGQDQATGLWYFAMEFVDGPTCRQLLTQQKRLSEDQALKIARDIAGALECAHQNGMVHRDVKPDNILVNQSGTAKLADLGLARQANDDAGLTQAGMALGTPYYMAPEQVRGEIDRLDTRADLYALGATLFHLVTGEPPFAGETSAVIMARHLSDPPPMANRVCSEVSTGCSKLILKLMQKDKAQRLQTPQELIDQIDRLLKLPPAARALTTGPRAPIRGATTTAPRDAVRPRLGNANDTASPPKQPVALYAGAGAGAVLVLGLVGFLLFSSGNKPAPQHVAPNPKPPAPEQPVTVAAPAAPSSPQTPAESPSKRSHLERRWDDAKAFAAAQPSDFSEILKRYRQLEQAAAGTALADQITTEIAAVETRLDVAAREALAALEKTLGERVSVGDYDGALAASRTLPPAIAEYLGDQLETRRAALADEASAKLQSAMQKAEAASSDADPEAGLKALETVAQVKFQPMAPELQSLKQRLETELANVDELRARKASLIAQRRLTEVLDRFDNALLNACDDAAAARIAKEARNEPALDPVRSQAEAMAALLDAAAAERRRQEEALEALKGRPFAVGKDQGTIERVADGMLSVKISLDGGKITATKTLKIEDLPAAQRNELFPPHTEMPDALRVEQAVRKMSKGQEDFAAAAELLNGAPDFPLTDHYLKMIQSRRDAALETEAQQAWSALSTAAEGLAEKPAQAKPLFGKLTAFFNDYGQTRFAAAHAEEMTALRTRLEQLVNPNLVRNGSFEEQGLDGWTLAVDQPENARRVADLAHGGTSCLRLARGTISQTLHLVPGQTYEARCWVKRSEYVGLVAFGIDRSTDSQLSRSSPLALLNDWTAWSIRFTAQRAEHTISLSIQTSPEARGAAFVDDVTVTNAGAVMPPTAAVIPPDALRFNGHAYKVYPTPVKIQVAKDRCQAMGGHLLFIESDQEQEFIRKSVAAVGQPLWLGLERKNRVWQWLSGEAVQLNHWVGGTPDPGVVARMMPPSAQWNACWDWRTCGFVCEWDALAPGTGGTDTTTAPPAASTTALAQFIAEDTRTQGNWKHFYGKDGCLIQGEEPKLPAYAKAACNGQPFLWEKTTTEVRALERVSGGRVAACWYSQPRNPMTCEVTLTDGREHTVALYFLDWKDRKDVTEVEVVDAGSGQVLDTRAVGHYVNGKYLVWRIKGAVQFRFRIQAGPNALLSGIFFQ